MDFALTDDQAALVAAVDTLLARHAGPGPTRPSAYTNLATGHAPVLCHPTLSGCLVMILICQHNTLSTYHPQRSVAVTRWRRE